jgi:hypothetical protein
MIRAPRPQRPFDGSAGIIAVFHALHRLLAPRHPPHALSSLAALAPPSNPDSRRASTDAAAKPPPSVHPLGRVTTLSLPQALQRSQKLIAHPEDAVARDAEKRGSSRDCNFYRSP